jgi:hypothetical protein
VVECLLAGKSADKMARLLRLCGIVPRMRMKLLLHATTTRAYSLIRSPQYHHSGIYEYDQLRFALLKVQSVVGRFRLSDKA